MNKQLIGVFRLVLFFVIIWAIDVPFNAQEFKIWVSDLVHGGDHSEAMRNTTSVYVVMFLTLGLMVFYVFQTIAYIFVPALQERNTSIVNFFRHVFRSFGEIRRDPYFWTSNSEGGTLNSIEQVLSYRDNKMALMTNAEAAQVMAKTSHIDMIMKSPNLKQSQQALSYLNNKVALMSNEEALSFIQGQK